MTDDKPKLNGIGKTVLIVMLAFVGVAFWICVEFGQWLSRQQ
jgi:hypothetical protein